MQTELVENFALKGFPEPVPVYRVQRRSRVQVIANVFILIFDLSGFFRLTRSAEVGVIERVLETFEACVNGVVREHDGTIRNSEGDSYLVTFLEASQAATAAAQFMRAWAVASDEDRSGCGFHLLLHLGTINVYRSFLFGKGVGEARRAMAASRQWLGGESGLFITAPVRDALSGHQLHNRLRLVGDTPAGGPEVYKLGDA